MYRPRLLFIIFQILLVAYGVNNLDKATAKRCSSRVMFSSTLCPCVRTITKSCWWEIDVTWQQYVLWQNLKVIRLWWHLTLTFDLQNYFRIISHFRCWHLRWNFTEFEFCCLKLMASAGMGFVLPRTYMHCLIYVLRLAVYFWFFRLLCVDSTKINV